MTAKRQLYRRHTRGRQLLVADRFSPKFVDEIVEMIECCFEFFAAVDQFAKFVGVDRVVFPECGLQGVVGRLHEIDSDLQHFLGGFGRLQ